MRVTATTSLPIDTEADTIVVGLIDGEKIHHDIDRSIADLVQTGDAKPRFKHLATTRAGGKRLIAVGLGQRDELDDERLRVAAALAFKRASELGADSICWELPHKYAGDAVTPIAEASIFCAYDFSLKRDAAEAPPGIRSLAISAHDDVAAEVARAAIVAEATNAARELGDTPANLMTPTVLAERAQAIDGVTVEVTGRKGIADLGMGAFSGVALGTEQDPKLIVMRYEPDPPARAAGPTLGLVGKAVTFDSGGISIKPSAKMNEMKFDMCGGAAVIETIGAIAKLGLALNVIGVVGATENLPSGSAVKPGDVVTAKNGLTIEVDNTDAEGRLVLADCLCHARDLGADRLIDVATLTGAIIVALGSTYTGLMGTDHEWNRTIVQAGAARGELLWEMPLHEEYSDAMKGTVADLTNAAAARKAGALTAGAFMQNFTGDVPWAHLDVAGTAWDTGKTYFGKGATGSMVRTMVAVAEGISSGA